MFRLSRRDRQLTEVRVWDLPTRVFHWLFAANFMLALVTNGDSRYLDIHVFGGYAVTMLLVFRLVWALSGTRYARFDSQALRYAAIKRYVRYLLRGNIGRIAGSSPAGAVALIAILVVGFSIAISGFITFGGEEQHGPYADWFSFESGVIAHEIHLALVWLMSAILVLYGVLVWLETTTSGQRLIDVVLHGKKNLEDVYDSVDNRSLIGFGLVSVYILFAVLSFKGYWSNSSETKYLPFVGPALVQSERWIAECGECHLPFHPSILPARSWVVMLNSLPEHFGKDIVLNQSTTDELLRYAVHNAAENQLTETASYMLYSIPMHESPQRITSTDYWKEKHDSIALETLRASNLASKSQCEACHLDAKEGTFQDAAIKMPEDSKAKSFLKLAIEQFKDET